MMMMMMIGREIYKEMKISAKTKTPFAIPPLPCFPPRFSFNIVATQTQTIPPTASFLSLSSAAIHAFPISMLLLCTQICFPPRFVVLYPFLSISMQKIVQQYHHVSLSCPQSATCLPTHVLQKCNNALQCSCCQLVKNGRQIIEFSLFFQSFFIITIDTKNSITKTTPIFCIIFNLKLKNM